MYTDVVYIVAITHGPLHGWVSDPADIPMFRGLLEGSVVFTELQRSNILFKVCSFRI